MGQRLKLRLARYWPIQKGGWPKTGQCKKVVGQNMANAKGWLAKIWPMQKGGWPKHGQCKRVVGQILANVKGW